MALLQRFAGFVWAAPLTALALVYVELFTLFGWYKSLGVHGDALVWLADETKMPNWLMNMWSKWAGHAFGNIVVTKYDPETDKGRITLRHEQEHVSQCSRLGPFMPFLYAISWLTIKIACKNSSPYYSHPLEIDARRAAGQVIDVEGVLDRARKAGVAETLLQKR